MNVRMWTRGKLLVIVAAAALPSQAQTINTAFTYQGQLKQNGTPVNETCDFAFTLWRDIGDFSISVASLIFDGQAGNGNPIPVYNGLFSVGLDFGGEIFNGDPLLLEVAVRCPTGAPGAMTTLSPLQRITAAPYSVRTRGILVDEAGHVSIGPPNPALQTTTAGDPAPPVLAVDGDSDFTGDVDIAGDVDVAGTVRLHAPLAAGTTAGTPPGMELIQNMIRSTDGDLEINNDNARRTHINNTLHVQTDGNVGIGTTNPEAALEVVGQVRTSGTGAAMRVANPNNPLANVLLNWLNDVPRIRVGGNGAGASNGFDIQSVGDRSLLRVLNNGNVGIGTTSPLHMLHLQSTSATTIHLEADTNNVGEADQPQITMSQDGGIITGGIGFFDSSNSMSIRTFDSGAGRPHLLLLPKGNVGIGTSSPDNKLHVHKGSAGAVTAHGNSALVVENSASGYISVLTPSSNEGGILFGNPDHNTAGGVVYNNPSTADGLQFRTNGNVTRMVVDGAGNVGIGITAPSAKLHVNGDARIAGDLVMNTRTCTIRKWPLDFQPTDGGKSYSLGSFGIEVPLSAAGQFTRFGAQLHFPEGARVTAMRALVEDTSASSEITVEFRSGWRIEDYSVSRSTVAVPNVTTLSANLNHVVDTTGSTSSYAVRASWTRPPSGLGDINLRWVEFDYETDQICPPR